MRDAPVILRAVLTVILRAVLTVILRAVLTVILRAMPYCHSEGFSPKNLILGCL